MKTKEEWLEYFSEYRKSHRKEIAKNHKEWRMRNKQKIRLKNKAYKERKLHEASIS